MTTADATHSDDDSDGDRGGDSGSLGAQPIVHPIVVVGAGYTGRRVLTAEPGATAIGRTKPSIPGANVNFVRFDLDHDQDPHDHGDGVADALSLSPGAAVLYTVPPPREGDDDPRLARFLARLTTRPARIVYLSTTGVYGDRGGARVTECDEPRPATARARRRLAAESLLQAWCAAHRVENVVLRVPGIYGPGRLGVDRLAAGAEILREADSSPGNRIHVDDLARCCLAALKPETLPGIYNVGDGDERSSGAFSRAVCEQAGLPAPEEIDLATAKQRWSPMRLSFVLESRRVDVSKMRERLCVELQYADPLAGIRASLQSTDV